MKYPVQKLTPDLFFIKRNVAGYYDVCLNWDWMWATDGSTKAIKIFQQSGMKYPRVIGNHSTYHKARIQIDFYLHQLEDKYNDGYTIEWNTGNVTITKLA